MILKRCLLTAFLLTIPHFADADGYTVEGLEYRNWSGSFASDNREFQRGVTEKVKESGIKTSAPRFEAGCLKVVNGVFHNECSKHLSIAYCIKDKLPEGYDGLCRNRHVQTFILNPTEHVNVQTWSGVPTVEVDFAACEFPAVPTNIEYDSTLQGFRGSCGTLKRPELIFSADAISKYNLSN